MPAELVQLMTTALAGGNVDEVSLVFEGMGYDFYAPIGWFLYLTKISPELHVGGVAADAQERESLLVTAQVNSPHPTAYKGTDPQTGAARYWDCAAITKWVTSPRDVALVGAPVIVPAEHVSMAVEAAKLGWTVNRQLRRFGRTAFSPPDLEIPTVVSYRFGASNYAYADPTSTSHHGTGADVSFDLALGTSDTSWAWNYALRGAERVDPADITAAVARNPPWHARVAHFDDDAEEWVL